MYTDHQKPTAADRLPYPQFVFNLDRDPEFNDLSKIRQWRTEHILRMANSKGVVRVRLNTLRRIYHMQHQHWDAYISALLAGGIAVLQNADLKGIDGELLTDADGKPFRYLDFGPKLEELGYCPDLLPERPHPTDLDFPQRRQYPSDSAEETRLRKERERSKTEQKSEDGTRDITMPESMSRADVTSNVTSEAPSDQTDSESDSVLYKTENLNQILNQISEQDLQQLHKERWTEQEIVAAIERMNATGKKITTPLAYLHTTLKSIRKQAAGRTNPQPPPPATAPKPRPVLKVKSSDPGGVLARRAQAVVQAALLTQEKQAQIERLMALSDDKPIRTEGPGIPVFEE